MDSRFEFKIIAIFIILALGIGGFCLPLIFGNKSDFLSIANCFSAGILFAAGLIHMLPDAEENLENWGPIDYPWPLFFTTSGFLLVLFIEEVSLQLISSSEEEETAPTLTRRISFSQRPKMSRDPLSINSRKASMVSVSASQRSISVQSMQSLVRGISFDDQYSYDASVDHGDHGDHGHMEFSDKSNTMLSILLLIALSVHSFLSGISLGSSKESLISIFIAIAAHKGCAAFALGTSFVQGNIQHSKPYLFKISAVLFASMTPSGILVGIILEKAHLIYPASEGIILCLAAGTFMYVATMEVMGHEFIKPDHKIPKMIALILGYAFMALLAIWV